jgi:protein O-mannosyl-transferase
MIPSKLAIYWRRGCVTVLAAAFTVSLIPATHGLALSEPVCNPTADYFLGNEDYPEAVRLHQLFIERHPDNATAHYHLGFAEGMMGDSADEIDQYQLAERLGLKEWDLYLNLGRAWLEKGQLELATAAFRKAVAFGPKHAEAHFNLGLVYERRGLLGAAAGELASSLAIDPADPDARNMMALVDAEQGNYPAARAIWTELVRSQPNYAPAQANLAILNSAVKRGHAGASNFQSASALTPK